MTDAKVHQLEATAKQLEAELKRMRGINDTLIGECRYAVALLQSHGDYIGAAQLLEAVDAAGG